MRKQGSARRKSMSGDSKRGGAHRRAAQTVEPKEAKKEAEESDNAASVHTGGQACTHELIEHHQHPDLRELHCRPISLDDDIARPLRLEPKRPTARPTPAPSSSENGRRLFVASTVAVRRRPLRVNNRQQRSGEAGDLVQLATDVGLERARRRERRVENLGPGDFDAEGDLQSEPKRKEQGRGGQLQSCTRKGRLFGFPPPLSKLRSVPPYIRRLYTTPGSSLRSSLRRQLTFLGPSLMSTPLAAITCP